MATTKIWKIEKRLDHVVDYAKDKKKTKNDYLENGFDKYGDIRQVVMYAGVRIDIWTHFMRGCIIDYVH